MAMQMLCRPRCCALPRGIREENFIMGRAQGYGCGREEEQKGLILNDYKDQPFGGLIPLNREVYFNHRAPAPGTVQRYGAGQVQT